ncbi:MAG: M16 family metallopeptidase [Thiotrichales bacterium]
MVLRIIGFALALAWLFPAHAGPKIENWQTSNGMRVYFVAAPELPMVDIRVTFSAGSARDAGASGLAALTNGMLNEGAGGMSVDAIAESFEGVGAQFGAGALRDMAWVSLRSLTDPDYIQPALETFAKVLWHPDFPERELARLKNQTLVALKAEEADPSSIASKAYYKAIYGDHPYASPSNGTPASVEALTRDDLKAFHQRYYTAANGLLAITGALSRELAEQLAETLSRGLPKGEAPAPVPTVSPLTKGESIKIAYPSNQAHVLIGQPGVERGNPDWYALYLGNHVLGGSGFTSRLVKEVRVKRGYAYSVYSSFSPMADKGPFLIGLQTRGNQVDDAIDVVRQTLAEFIKDSADEDEIKASKLNITGGFPLRIASNSSIVEYLAVIGFYNLPLDYLDTFTGKVEAVTREDIARLYARHLNPEAMVTVVVGGEGT